MPPTPPPIPPPLPDYCCAILQSSDDGTLLLERRPPGAARAPARLTCFGGRREESEAPDDCIRRELLEELGWTPGALTVAVTLLRRGRPLAWFYRADAPPPSVILRPEPGHEPVWLRPDDLAAAPVSDWHRAALDAFLAGQAVATVDG